MTNFATKFNNKADKSEFSRINIKYIQRIKKNESLSIIFYFRKKYKKKL